jgi:DNA-binding NarL/FixJ family response regulator
MTKVLLVDRSELILKTASAMLSRYPDMEVIGAVSTLPDAIRVIEEFIPDVTVLDLSMVDRGAESAQQALALVENSRNVVCMSLLEAKDVKKLASLIGVAVCVDKMDLYDELPKTIRKVGMAVSAPN